jgi:hypothetical protein
VCLIFTPQIPVGDSATISSKAVETALAASIGAANGDNVVIMPTGYRVIGAHSCNPTGTTVGLHFEDSDNLAHVHVGSRSGEAEHFAAVLANRYHPTSDSLVALSASKANQQSIEERVEIAQKW